MKIGKKLLICFIAFIPLISFMPQGVSAQQKFSPEDIKSDIDFMINLMEHSHVNLYFHFPREKFYNEISEVKNGIKDSLNRIEVWKRFSLIIAKLKDGHTSLRFPFTDSWNYFKNGGLQFPFGIKIVDDKIFVEKNFTGDESICSGSEIIKINKIKSAAIIEKMLKHASGEKDSFKKVGLTNFFNLMLWALFETGGEFSIEYYSYSEKKLKVKIFPGISIEGLSKFKNAGNEIEMPYSLKYLQNETVAFINFKSFSNLEMFKKFLKETFRAIKEKNITKLIIDIRKNGGGNSSLGDALLNYITDKKYLQYSRVDIKLSNSVKESWGGEYKKMKTDTLLVYKDIELKAPENPEDKYNGTVFLLTGNATFSSANAFSSVFKCFNIGLIIGEETGGLTVHYGDVLSFKTPVMKMDFGVSHKKFWEACGKEDGKGVIPDIIVKQKREDTINGVDTVLEYALDLLEKKSK
jgi:hypothetical protein